MVYLIVMVYLNVLVDLIVMMEKNIIVECCVIRQCYKVLLDQIVHFGLMSLIELEIFMIGLFHVTKIGQMGMESKFQPYKFIGDVAYPVRS